MRTLSAFLLILGGSVAASGQTYTISTAAGGGLPVNMPGSSASLFQPAGIAVDAQHNVFFTNQNTVLRLDAITGILTLVAGSSAAGFGGDDGLASNALLNNPAGLAFDSGGKLYIADAFNGRIRRISDGVITTIAGGGSAAIGAGNYTGSATGTQLNNPTGVAVDSAGNIYVVEDEPVGVLLKVSNGIISPVAGLEVNGSADQLNSPRGVALDANGDVYIADTGNQRIRELANGTVSTVAGNGTAGYGGDGGAAANAQLNMPQGLAVDSAGDIFIADADNNRIRKVNAGTITTVAGSVSGDLSAPSGVAVDSAGNIYIPDSGNNRIREVSGGLITTVAGNGSQNFGGDSGLATSAQLNPGGFGGVAVDGSGNVYIADRNNNRVRKVANGVIVTVAGNGTRGFGGDNGAATSAALNYPSAVAVDAAGNVYIADTFNNRIRMVAGGLITTVAGNGTQGYAGDRGPAIAAELNQPAGLVIDATGNLYIADTLNARLREVTNGTITTVAGNGTPGVSGDGGSAISAQLDTPTGVAVDASGNLYIADPGTSNLREVSKGVITTVATVGFGADGIAVDSGGSLYIAATSSGLVRRLSNGVLTSIAGNGIPGFAGDNGPSASAQLNNPSGVAVDTTGRVYIADSGNYRVRLLTPGVTPSIKLSGVVPVGSAVPVVQPGSWISIYGSNLATGTFLWNDDFPVSLGGVSVNIDNTPAYLWFVSPYQINVQVPADTNTGVVPVALTGPTGTTTSTVTLAPYGPSFSLLGDGRHVAGEIATPSGNGAYGSYDLVGPSNTFSYNTRPVQAGETLVLFGVGFGPTTPLVPPGQLYFGAAGTTLPVTITIGGVNANVVFAGITEAGLYQFNLTVPAGTGSGDQPVMASVNGVQTPAGPVVTVQ